MSFTKKDVKEQLEVACTATVTRQRVHAMWRAYVVARADAGDFAEHGPETQARVDFEHARRTEKFEWEILGYRLSKCPEAIAHLACMRVEPENVE